MNVFQLIKSVLDEIYKEIPVSDDSKKDRLIRSKLTKMMAEYRQLKNGVFIDYSDPITRFAYIYKYVTSHANYVYSQLTEYHSLINVLKEPEIKITCVGGGPGSDFLGILKFLQKNRLKPDFLKCYLFDKEDSWSEAWDDVDEKLSVQFRISTNYKNFNVIDPSTWETKRKSFNSDIFTLIYFMSEIYGLRKESETFFDFMFSQINHGSYVLYIDNNSPDFYEWFDLLINKYDYDILLSQEKQIQISDYSEEKRDLAEYYEKFGDPKLVSDVAIRICRKK